VADATSNAEAGGNNDNLATDCDSESHQSKLGAESSDPTANTANETEKTIGGSKSSSSRSDDTASKNSEAKPSGNIISSDPSTANGKANQAEAEGQAVTEASSALLIIS